MTNKVRCDVADTIDAQGSQEALKQCPLLVVEPEAPEFQPAKDKSDIVDSANRASVMGILDVNSKMNICRVASIIAWFSPQEQAI